VTSTLGGDVTAIDTIVGGKENVTGTFTINDGSLTNSGIIYVGRTGAGTVTQSGGDVVAGGVLIARDTGSQGTYTLSSDGELTVPFITIGQGTGVFNFNGGTLKTKATNFDVVNQGGTFGPGQSPGISTVPSYTQDSSATLEIEIGGTTAGNGDNYHDQLDSDGDITLDGTLKVVTWNNFDLTFDQEFTILEWEGTLSGTFHTFDLPTLSSGALKWVTENLYSEGKISIVMDPTPNIISFTATPTQDTKTHFVVETNHASWTASLNIYEKGASTPEYADIKLYDDGTNGDTTAGDGKYEVIHNSQILYGDAVVTVNYDHEFESVTSSVSIRPDIADVVTPTIEHNVPTYNVLANNFTVSLNAIDGDSGAYQLFYQINTGAWTEVKNTSRTSELDTQFVVSNKDGVTINFYAVDYADNVMASESAYLVVDSFYSLGFITDGETRTYDSNSNPIISAVSDIYVGVYGEREDNSGALILESGVSANFGSIIVGDADAEGVLVLRDSELSLTSSDTHSAIGHGSLGQLLMTNSELSTHPDTVFRLSTLSTGEAEVTLNNSTLTVEYLSGTYKSTLLATNNSVVNVGEVLLGFNNGTTFHLSNTSANIDTLRLRPYSMTFDNGTQMEVGTLQQVITSTEPTINIMGDATAVSFNSTTIRTMKMYISEGADVYLRGSQVFYTSTGFINVSGEGTRLHSDFRWDFASESGSHGVLRVTDGAEFNMSGNVDAGVDAAGARAEFLIEDATTRFNVTNLYLGSLGSATVTMNNGLAEFDTVTVGGLSGTGTGLFTHNDGIVTINTSLEIAKTAGSTGTYTFNGGILDVASATVSDGSGTATFDWNGGTVRAGTFTFDVTNTSGILEAGSGYGVAEFEGDYTQGESATLNIELNGYNVGSNADALHVSGNLTLDGSLVVTLPEDFDPVLGASFDIIDWDGTISGTFDEVVLPALTGGKFWSTASLYSHGKLFVYDTIDTFVITGLLGSNQDAGASRTYTGSDGLIEPYNTDVVLAKTGVADLTIESSGYVSFNSLVMQESDGAAASLNVNNATLRIHGGDSTFAGNVTFNNGADVRFDDGTFGEFHDDNTVFVGGYTEIRAHSIEVFSDTEFTVTNNAAIYISEDGFTITGNAVTFNMGSNARLETETGITMSASYATVNIDASTLDIGTSLVIDSYRSIVNFDNATISADHFKGLKGSVNLIGDDSVVTIGSGGMELGHTDGSSLLVQGPSVSVDGDIAINDDTTVTLYYGAFLDADRVIVDSDATAEITIGGTGSRASFDVFELSATSTLNIGFETYVTTNAIQGDGTLKISGGTLATSLIGMSVTVNYATLRPGKTTDQLVVSGNYTQADTATLEIDAAGNEKGISYDTLYVTGDVTLDGTLEFKYIDGYTESIDQVYDILDWDGTLTGEFDTIILPPTENAASFWVTSNLYIDGTIKMESTRKYIAIASTNHGEQETYSSSDTFDLGATNGVIGIDNLGLVRLHSGAILDQASITLAKETGGSAIFEVTSNSRVNLTNGLTMSNAGPSTVNIGAGASITMGGDLVLANTDVESVLTIESGSLSADSIAMTTGNINYSQAGGSVEATDIRLSTDADNASSFIFTNSATLTLTGSEGFDLGTSTADIRLFSGAEVSANRLRSDSNNFLSIRDSGSHLYLNGPEDTVIKQGSFEVKDSGALTIAGNATIGHDGNVIGYIRDNGTVVITNTLDLGRGTSIFELNLNTGGRLEVATLNVGVGSASSTNIEVADTGTSLEADAIVLGVSGAAQLDAYLSSSVSANTMILAKNASATSQFNSRGTTRVEALTMASAAGSNATVNIVSGVFTADEITVGDNGTAAIAQSGGSLVVNTMTLAAESGSRGSYALTGGSLSVGTVIAGDGTVSFDLQTGSIFGNSFQMSDVSFGAVTVFNANTDIGGVLFSGDATFDSGSVINIEIATENRYDYLDVTGTLDNDANLSIALREGFSPAGEYTFHLFRASTLDLDFGTVLLPSLPDGFLWDQSELETEGKLHLVFDRNHDTDGDGVSNFHDTYPLDSARSTASITIVSPEMRARFDHDTASVSVTVEYIAPFSFDGYWSVTLNSQFSDVDPITFQVTASDDLTVTVDVNTATIYRVSAALLHADGTRITSSNVDTSVFVIKKDLTLAPIVASVNSTTLFTTDMDKGDNILDIDGELIVKDASRVTVDRIELGTKANAEADLRVRDAATRLYVENDILVGARSLLVVESGALLETGQEVMVSGDLHVEAGGTVNIGATLNVENIVTIDGHIRANVFEVESSATLIGLGGSLSADKITGPNGADINLTLNNFGIAPGQSPGTTIVVGDLVMTESSYLTMEIASTTNMDRINVLGEFTTNGTLRVELIDDFVPTMNQVFDIFDWITIDASAGFADIILPTLPEEITWNVENLTVDGTLSIVTGNVDRDGDGVLDSEDAFPFDPFLQVVPTVSASLPVSEGLALWLDATQPHGDQETTTDMKLQTWIDLSGNDNHAEQPYEALRPTRSATSELRNNQAVLGNGSAYFSLPRGEVLVSKDVFEIFMVGIKRSNSGVDYAINFGGTELALGSNVAQTLVQQSGNTPSTVTEHTLTQDRGYLLNASQSTSGGVMTLDTILSSKSAETPATTGSYAASISDDSRYILSNAGADGWDGEIGEIIIYNRQLSESERAQIEGYLRSKWGLLMSGSVDIFFGTE
jgi:hypothetical protein